MRIAALALALLILVPTVVAGNSAPAPMDLRAESVSGLGVLLSWTEPEGADPIEYRIYAHGEEVANTTETFVSTLWAPKFSVRAVYLVNGQEQLSSPATTYGPVPIVGGFLFGDDGPIQPGIFLNRNNDEYNPTYNLVCYPSGSSTNWNNPPFLFIGFNTSCQRGIWWTIGINGWSKANGVLLEVYGAGDT